MRSGAWGGAGRAIAAGAARAAHPSAQRDNMGLPRGAKRQVREDGSTYYLLLNGDTMADPKSAKRSAGGASGASGAAKKSRSADLSPARERDLISADIVTTIKNMHEIVTDYGPRFHDQAELLEELQMKFPKWVRVQQVCGDSTALLKVFLQDRLIGSFHQVKHVLHPAYLKVSYEFPTTTADADALMDEVTLARNTLGDFTECDTDDIHILKDVSDNLKAMIGGSANPPVLAEKMVVMTEDDDGNVHFHPQQSLNALRVCADKLQEAVYNYQVVYDRSVNYLKFMRWEQKIKYELASVTTAYDEMITNKSFKMAPPAPALNFQIMHREQSLVPAGGGSAAAEAAPTQLTDLD
jgi:hypothetical protein